MQYLNMIIPLIILAVFGLNKHQKYIQRYLDTITEYIKLNNKMSRTSQDLV